MTLIPVWIWWTVALVLYAVGEWIAKRWSEDQLIHLGMLSLLAYTVSSTCWLGIMAHSKKLTLMSTLWEIGSLLLAAVVGVLLFGETLTPTQWIGFFLAIIAGILLIA